MDRQTHTQAYTQNHTHPHAGAPPHTLTHTSVIHTRSHVHANSHTRTHTHLSYLHAKVLKVYPHWGQFSPAGGTGGERRGGVEGRRRRGRRRRWGRRGGRWWRRRGEERGKEVENTAAVFSDLEKRDISPCSTHQLETDIFLRPGPGNHISQCYNGWCSICVTSQRINENAEIGRASCRERV